MSGNPIRGMRGRPGPALQVIILPKDREAFNARWIQPYPFIASHWQSVPVVAEVLGMIEAGGREVVDAWRQQANSDRLLISFRPKSPGKNFLTEPPLPDMR